MDTQFINTVEKLRQIPVHAGSSDPARRERFYGGT
ncbi:hypothetical protein M2244_002691 [Rhodoferax antarcticus]|nr:hypothetical protein [Rhodoferax antarcticus]